MLNKKEIDARLMNNRLPRLAASSYLNTAPLIWSFQHGTQAGGVDLVTDTAPARSAELLARGEVDAALVPVIELARITNVELVPSVCVAARHRVRSVVLATRDGRELKDVRSVELDAASRTSVALARIIFREFIQREARFVNPKQRDAGEAAEETNKTDARLIIGDPAMRLDARAWRIFDLAEVWRGFTGCGFVFAMWMRGTAERAAKTKAVDFAAARDEGLANTADIIRRFKADTNHNADMNHNTKIVLTDAELHGYLHDAISYRLDDELRAGLQLFFRLAHKHDLIQCVPQPVFAV